MRAIAIMQPYVFPYIGYFQLIHTAECFVFYNDVNFIKKGWINRNRILLNGEAHLFTIPCTKVTQNRMICETPVSFEGKERDKLLGTIRQAYAKAPHFDSTYPMIERVLLGTYETIDQLAEESVRRCCEMLNMKVRMERSQNRYGNAELKKADRLIDICRKEGYSTYINAIGGAEIYDKPSFASQGIELHFLKTLPVVYAQFGQAFVSNLSVIDVLMFNEPSTVSKYIANFELV